jgi:hypothetical protein
METREIQVTPLLAQKMLKENLSNRKVTPKTVWTYAKDMQEGRWKSKTGEFIKISKTQRLLDGQHRLLAVIKSNSTIDFSICYGIEDEVFDVLDTGKNRSRKDVFTIDNIPNANIVSSIINSYLVLQKGNTVFTAGKNSTGITNTMVLECYRKNPEYWTESTKFTIKIYNSFAKILSLNVIGGFYSFFNDINPESAREFFNQVGTGENITNTTISSLRKILLQDKISSRKMQSRHKNALIIKAWNAFRNNNNIKTLRFDVENDNYPKPI